MGIALPSLPVPDAWPASDIDTPAVPCPLQLTSLAIDRAGIDRLPVTLSGLRDLRLLSLHAALDSLQARSPQCPCVRLGAAWGAA